MCPRVHQLPILAAPRPDPGFGEAARSQPGEGAGADGSLRSSGPVPAGCLRPECGPAVTASTVLRGVLPENLPGFLVSMATSVSRPHCCWVINSLFPTWVLHSAFCFQIPVSRWDSVCYLMGGKELSWCLVISFSWDGGLPRSQRACAP